MKTYPVSGFWRNIMPCPADHGLLSAQRVVFQLKKYMKLYHLAMVQRSRSSASDAMVDFFERDPENSTLSPVYNLTARYTFFQKRKNRPRLLSVPAVSRLYAYHPARIHISHYNSLCIYYITL